MITNLMKAGTLVASMSFVGSALAMPVNLDFETGDLTGWTSLGPASVIGVGYGDGPIEGSFSGLLETGVAGGAFSGPDTLGSPTDSEIETFLGLGAGTLGALTPFGVTEGAAIKQTFAGSVGDKIAFDLMVLADDCLIGGCLGGVEDFAFVSLTIDGVLSVLASTFDASMTASTSPYAAQSAVLSFSHTLATAGSVTLGIAMLDGSDTVVSSGLLIDAAKVPVPAPLALLGLGLAALGFSRRKRA